MKIENVDSFRTRITELDSKFKKAVLSEINQFGYVRKDVQMNGSKEECEHNWQRRRDGKWCCNCGEIRFGEFIS